MRTLCLLLFAFIQSVYAVPVGQQLIQQHWNEGDGLPAGDITGLVQDSAGYLWLATFEGLIQFDGVEFTRFDTSNTDLPSNRFTTIRKTDDDVLWLSSEQGHLVRFMDEQARVMGTDDGMPNIRVVRVTPPGDFGLAYGTVDGVALVTGEQLIGLPLSMVKGEVTAMHWPSQEVLWVATKDRLYQVANPMRDATVKQWPLDQEIWSLMTADERLWLGTETGLLSFDTASFEKEFEEHITRVTLIRRMPTGELLIGGDLLWRISEQQVENIAPFDNNILVPMFVTDNQDRNYMHSVYSLFNDSGEITRFNSAVSDLLLGQEGGIWVATVPG